MEQLSIFGDSVSTYEGYNPVRYDIFYRGNTILKNGLSGVEDTWWYQVSRFLGMSICVNNSFSGSRVTGNRFPAASSGERYQQLHNGLKKPELVLIYLGFNDFGNGVKIKKTGFGDLLTQDELYFEKAYEIMLEGIKKTYPNTYVVCATLMKTRVKDNDKWEFPERYGGIEFDDYNDAIRIACKNQNCYLADLGASSIRYETLDGSHPTVGGHKTISGIWISCLSNMPFIRNGIS